MNEVNNILFALLRSAVFSHELDSGLFESFDSEKLDELYSLSKKHDLAHLVAAALDKENLSDDGETGKRFSDEIFAALYRVENQIYETERICHVLSAAKIDHIPLKGAIIRDLYPEKWMRTSCDIDILVRECDLSRATEVLKNELKYTCDEKKDFHDVHLFSENGIHLEFHFNIRENDPQLDNVLDRAWEYAHPLDKNSFEYRMTPEFLIYHIVAHASYHFVGGGCGIRPFLDLFLLLKEDFDPDILHQLCADSGIDEFFTAMKHLSDVWFGESEHTPLTARMEEYVLSGGVYGTREANVAARQDARGGKMGYIISRIFVSYDHLRRRYPTLRSRVAVPVYQARRWIDLMRNKSLSHSFDELEVTRNLDKEKVREVNSLMRDLKLSEHIK